MSIIRSHNTVLGGEAAGARYTIDPNDGHALAAFI